MRPGPLLSSARSLASGPIARSSAASLAIRLAGLALSFAQAVLTARLLGPEGYGTVAVVMSLVAITATVTQFGLGALAVREVAARLAANDATGLRSFVRFALKATVLLSLAGAALLVLADSGAVPVPVHYRGVLGLGAMLVLPLALVGLLRGIAQGFGRIALAQVPGELVRPAGLVLAIGGATLLGLRFAERDYVIATAGIAALAALLAAGWLWWCERERLSDPAPAGKHPAYAAAALPFLGLALTIMLQGEMNTLLLGWLAGPRETGLFQPIVRLAPVLSLAIEAAAMRYAPRMAEFWQRGETERIRSVTATFTWTTTLATLAAALTIAASGPWLLLFFGPEFQQSAPLLWWVAGAQVFNAACGPVAVLLNMASRTKGALIAQFGGLIANGSACLLLIPTLGAKGAVIGLSLAIVISNLINLYFLTSTFGINPSLFGRMTKSARK